MCVEFKPKVRVGLQRLAEDGLQVLRGKRIGVVTNHTGVTPSFRHIVDLLYSDLRLNVKAVFSPEHGFRGDVASGVFVESHRDSRTGLPVYSLYGAERKPSKSLFSRIDAVVYDIQDVGVRFYTYISTLFYVLEAAGESGVKTFILDRPNPITGVYVEGPILDVELRSFVGIWELPVRYGMTVGELALLFNGEAGLDADLEVFEMEGWSREMWFDETGLPWIPPSPNMPSLSTATVYPGTCLLEGVNVSDGRGTTKPFELVGAPWIDEYKLAEELENLSFKGVCFRPSTFIPQYGKYAGQLCHGLQIYVVNRDLFEPVKLGLAIIWAVKRLHSKKLQFIRRNGRYYFDLLIGDSIVRELIEEGCDFNELVDVCDGIKQFNRVRVKYLLY